jgi:hypothetical protein
MLRHVPIRIALAFTCAVGLSACSGSDNQDPTATGYALAAAGDLALAAAAAAGMTMVPLPAMGCGTSLLEPQRVVELLYTLPEAQQTALATVLDASVGVWTAQLYRGDQGVGLCLPVQQVLFILPSSANAVVDSMASAVEPLQGALPVGGELGP